MRKYSIEQMLERRVQRALKNRNLTFKEAKVKLKTIEGRKEFLLLPNFGIKSFHKLQEMVNDKPNIGIKSFRKLEKMVNDKPNIRLNELIFDLIKAGFTEAAMFVLKNKSLYERY